MNAPGGTDRPSPGSCSDHGRSILALTLVPGLGPVRIANLIEAFGSVDAVLGASASRIGEAPGIGSKTAASIAMHLHSSIDHIDRELERIADHDAHVVAIGDPGYPPLLASIPGAPPILTVRGHLDIGKAHKYPCAIVGSRDCSIYGVEQAGRFAGAIGSAGVCVVSGGARGIDTAAHRGSLNAGGQSIVVLGCGIAHAYPPENATLFDEVVERGGAIISELPLQTKPDAKNFPARNRIISGLSLGVLVIEAGRKSGALITARHANEDHGREVMALPGRVDSPSSAGSLDLLRDGAHLVVEPGDVLDVLRQDARHFFYGTHDAKTMDPSHAPSSMPSPLPEPEGLLGDIYRAISEPVSADALSESLDLDPGALRSQLTMLEVQGLIRREGSRFTRVR
jgi:DNA processing protein